VRVTSPRSAPSLSRNTVATTDCVAVVSLAPADGKPTDRPSVPVVSPVTVTSQLADAAPTVAVTVPDPVAAPARNRPLASTVPMSPSTVHVGTSCMGSPFASVTRAEHCSVAPLPTVAVAGVTATDATRPASSEGTRVASRPSSPSGAAVNATSSEPNPDPAGGSTTSARSPGANPVRVKRPSASV